MNESRTKSGYDYEFVKEIPEDYICVICHLAMRNPVQTVKCGHQFCKECLDEAYKRTRQCPVDREPLVCQDIFPNKFTERKILSLEVKCSRNECKWQGELRNIEKHDSKCDYKVVDCDNKGCSVNKARHDMVRHVQEECQYRMVLCPYCNNHFMFFYLEEHIDKCPKCPISCSNDCGQTLERIEITNHLSNECPLTIIPCTFQSIGCTVVEQRKDLSAHNINYAEQHLNIAVEEIVSLRNEIDELKNQTAPLSILKDLQKQMEKLKKQTAPLHTVKDLQKQMEELKKQTVPLHTVKDLQKQIDTMKKQTAPLQALKDLQDKMDVMTKHTVQTNKQVDELKKELTCSANVMNENEIGYLSYVWEIENASTVLSDGAGAVNSASFYTQRNGYKLMLDISNTTLTLYAVCGEYDAKLDWPLCVNEVRFFFSLKKSIQLGAFGKHFREQHYRGLSIQRPRQGANVPIATCNYMQSQYHHHQLYLNDCRVVDMSSFGTYSDRISYVQPLPAMAPNSSVTDEIQWRDLDFISGNDSMAIKLEIELQKAYNFHEVDCQFVAQPINKF